MDGNQLKSRPGATLRIGGLSRNSVLGDDEVHGYTEAVVAPRIECTISHNEDTSLVELDNVKDASITFECDNGKTYIMSPAWRADDPSTLNSQEGSVPYVFEGVRCEEM